MDKKISIIQDSEDTAKWHWVILKYDKGWYNADCGLEDSYEEACTKARIAYGKN